MDEEKLEKPARAGADDIERAFLITLKGHAAHAKWCGTMKLPCLVNESKILWKSLLDSVIISDEHCPLLLSLIRSVF